MKVSDATIQTCCQNILYQNGRYFSTVSAPAITLISKPAFLKNTSNTAHKIRREFRVSLSENISCIIIQFLTASMKTQRITNQLFYRIFPSPLPRPAQTLTSIELASIRCVHLRKNPPNSNKPSFRKPIVSFSKNELGMSKSVLIINQITQGCFLLGCTCARINEWTFAREKGHGKGVIIFKSEFRDIMELGSRDNISPVNPAENWFNRRASEKVSLSSSQGVGPLRGPRPRSDYTRNKGTAKMDAGQKKRTRKRSSRWRRLKRAWNSRDGREEGMNG